MNLYKCLMVAIVVFSVLSFASVEVSDIIYSLGFENIMSENMFYIFVFIVCFMISIFSSLYLFIRNRRESELKGGVFFEEDDEKNIDDDSKIRTHHIITKNDYSLSKIQATDEFFDEIRFLLFAKGIFVKLQYAWHEKDLDTIKRLETDDLYEEHEIRLNEFKENKQVNVIDKISVHSANIYSFEQKMKKEYLYVILNVSMIDYMINEETNEVIYGNSDFKVNVTYLMEFERKKGVKTKKDDEKRKKNIDISGKNCPNCGAELDPKLYGFCEYCMGRKKDEESWLLSGIEIFEK